MEELPCSFNLRAQCIGTLEQPRCQMYEADLLPSSFVKKIQTSTCRRFLSVILWSKMLSRKKEEKRTLKTTSAKLEITFSVSSLGTVCRARHWPPLQFPLREPIWHYHVFRMEASLQTANKLSQSTDSPVFTCRSHVRAVFTSTQTVFHRPSCVRLYFSTFLCLVAKQKKNDVMMRTRV